VISAAFLVLAEISLHDATERKVFVQVRPVKAVGGNSDIVQLRVGAASQTRILRDREANLDTTLHRDDDVLVTASRFQNCVSQGTHATSEL